MKLKATIASVAILLLAVRVGAVGAYENDNNSITSNPYEIIGGVYSVPPWLLYSICKVESNLNPFALNHKGQGYHFRSAEDAGNFLKDVGDNVDVGIGQINCKYWCRRLRVTKEQLLDPWVNLSASAFILSLALAENLGNKKNPSPRDFWKAVSTYHSRLNNRQIAYSWQVFKVARKTFMDK